MYSATGIGPVAFILEVRWRSMEGCLLFPSGAELQKSLEGAACHRTVTQKHSICTFFFFFKKRLLFFSEGGGSI